jgi:dCMP deaminase
MKLCKPNKKIIEVIRAPRFQDMKICILTARTSKYKKFISDFCRLHAIPFDFIITGKTNINSKYEFDEIPTALHKCSQLYTLMQDFDVKFLYEDSEIACRMARDILGVYSILVSNGEMIRDFKPKDNTQKKQSSITVNSVGQAVRPSINQYFMNIAQMVSLRSTCLKKRVGAVITKDNDRQRIILSTGYNGAPSGLHHCTKNSCLRLKSEDNLKSEVCRAVHAEINAIIQCGKNGTVLTGHCQIYTTTFPCISCLKAIINAGIKEIYYIEDYETSNDIKKWMLRESNVKTFKLESNLNI